MDAEHTSGSSFCSGQFVFKWVSVWQEDVFSREETAAAIAVLLGVPPPVMLSSASSARVSSNLRSF